MDQIEVPAHWRIPVRARPEVAAWVAELKPLWDSCDLSYRRFCALHPGIDPSTLSRYLNGERVPSSRWFLDRLLAWRAAAGTPLTDEARQYLIQLHLQALAAAHPQEYRVLRVKGELEIAVIQLRESTRYARGLEEQLNDRNRQLSDLTAAHEQLRTATNDQASRLRQEITDLTRRLRYARQQRDDAETRCRRLEDILDHLAPSTGDTDHRDPRPDSLGARLGIAVDHLQNADSEHHLASVHALAQISQESSDYHEAITVILINFIRTYRRDDEPTYGPTAGPTLPVLGTDRAPLHAALNFLRRRELGGADLQALDLSGLDLRGIYLGGVDLRGARLCGADLREAYLRAARLDGADLRGVNLGGANLEKSNLTGADLGGANLAGATLVEARLEFTSLIGTSLRSADLSEAKLVSAEMYQADLRDANLTRAHLENTNLAWADLQGVQGLQERKSSAI